MGTMIAGPGWNESPRPEHPKHAVRNGVLPGRGSVDGLLWKVLVVDEFPYVLGNLFILFDHHLMAVIAIQLDTQLGHPLIQTGRARRIPLFLVSFSSIGFSPGAR